MVVASRWVIALAWDAIAVAATLLLPSIEESQNGALGDLVPSDAAAIDAEIRSSQLFGFPLLSRSIVIQRDPTGLDAGAQLATVNRAAAITATRCRSCRGSAGRFPCSTRPPCRHSRASRARRRLRTCTSALTCRQ